MNWPTPLNARAARTSASLRFCGYEFWSVLERQLNLRQIVLRVALENQARAFDANFARREGEVEFPLVRLFQDSPVGRQKKAKKRLAKWRRESYSVGRQFAFV